MRGTSHRRPDAAEWDAIVGPVIVTFTDARDTVIADLVEFNPRVGEPSTVTIYPKDRKPAGILSVPPSSIKRVAFH